MLKKLLFVLAISAISIQSAFADITKIKINITDPVKANTYFACIYGVGCLSIKAANQGKVFASDPVDLSNMLKFVIANGETMQIYTQPIDSSCTGIAGKNQTLTISGKLVVTKSGPVVKNLHCNIA